MTKASDVVKVAVSQIGYKESPANSNKTKYGKVFGENGEPWCAIFLWWDFQTAKAGSLFPHNSNAAYAQDQIVSRCGGSWVMKKNTSRSARKAYLAQAKPGDVVCFDFGRMDAYRSHIGIVEKVSGQNIICIEGNTSKSGSQSNGGMVCRQVRPYTYICAAARPAYSDAVKPVPPTPDPVTKPLTVDGILGYQTACRLQKWLGVSVDGEVGPNTVRALQKKVGAKPVDGKWGKGTSKTFQKYLNKNGAKLAVDGVFGKASVRALQTYLNRYFAYKPNQTTTPAAPKNPSTEKTKADQIVETAKKCAWAYGTPKHVYAYPDGSPTGYFKEAIKQAYPDRSSWGKQTRAGASCDVFVGVVLRACGVDPKFPRGLDGVEKHCKGNNKWQTIKGITKESQLKPGDVIFQLFKGSGGHIFIYLGNGKIANAHYVGKTYGIVQSFSSTTKPSKCKTYNVYRAK